MKRDDPVRKTLVRVSLLILLFGVVAAGALFALFPGMPVLFKLAVPAVCALTAANLYALSTRPRGEYTRHSVDTFNMVFKPLKPLDAAPPQQGEIPRQEDGSKPRAPS